MHVAIIGAGSWGSALAMTALEAENRVTLWTRSQLDAEELRQGRIPLLPEAVLPSEIYCTTVLEDIKTADICILAVPSPAVREVASSLNGIAREDAIIVSVSKGLEAGSLKRMSQIIDEELPKNPVVVLSGPSHAEEVAKKLPTVVVSASHHRESAEAVQEALSTACFRIYTNPDVVGVEISGTVKNVIALASGISDGLGFEDNTKAALMTRGLSEIVRLGTRLGGTKETFLGLAGIGDLIVTCTSMHSRNRRAGILIGQGRTAEAAVKAVGTVEGYNAAKNVNEIAIELGIELPIICEVYRIIFEGAPADEAIYNLMTRPYKSEI
ncbi:MAG: NAD(P)-dependent glycerol-3-phosphate dehydrogenase [Oscillospiraceae bacterium]|jgi:glycerol-3-phosphate dehydrogenase (NAD(P)+)|nr:NAD(P)-dependent glycerol-3-phosphate dehydrogenase [Oscillospiraceae bacterium]